MVTSLALSSRAAAEAAIVPERDIPKNAIRSGSTMGKVVR